MYNVFSKYWVLKHPKFKLNHVRFSSCSCSGACLKTKKATSGLFQKSPLIFCKALNLYFVQASDSFLTYELAYHVQGVCHGMSMVLDLMLWNPFECAYVCNALITVFLSKGYQEIVMWHHHQTPGRLPRLRWQWISQTVIRIRNVR